MSVVRLEVLRCERVAIGPFERGPLDLVYEFHGNAEPPEPCWDLPFNRIQVLERLWLSDPELADFLNATWALPVVHGTMEWLETGGFTKVSFHTAGGSPSSIEYIEYLPDDRSQGFSHLWLWARGDTLYGATIESTFVTNDPQLFRYHAGTPSLAEEYGLREWTPLGDIQSPYDATWEFEEFTDMECGRDE